MFFMLASKTYAFLLNSTLLLLILPKNVFGDSHMVVKEKSVKPNVDSAENVEASESDAEFAELVDKIGNVNSVLAPSNINDADYKIVGKGIADIDYKDGNGSQRVPYWEFQDYEGTIIKAKVTSRLKEALIDSGLDYEHEAFHFRSAGKNFNVTITITPASEGLA